MAHRRELDEDDVRVRPGRGSRPRSKERPQHAGAFPAAVTAVDRGRYTCRLLDGSGEVTAMKARELGRMSVVVGDRVDLVGDVSGATGSLARVVRVQPRASVLRRSADDSDPVERVIVANATQLVVVTSVAQPEPRSRLVDRCLVAAYDAGLKPLLVITKTDLGEPGPLLSGYVPLGVTHVLTRRTASGIDGLDELWARLHGQVSVLVGHSGVGKSTLVNEIVPGTARVTGAVNAVTGRGRHTSTSAVALQLPDASGWVVDTPGVRSFGLAHVDLRRVVHAFADLEPGTQTCPRSCSHDEPECGLDQWVAAGHADPVRLDSLRRLLRARERDAGD